MEHNSQSIDQCEMPNKDATLYMFNIFMQTLEIFKNEFDKTVAFVLIEPFIFATKTRPSFVQEIF